MATQTLETPRRRSLRLRSFDEVLADAQRAHDEQYVGLGNWSLGKVLMHLGHAMEASIDGVPFPTSRRTRLLGRFVFRYVILYWQFPPGVQLPRKTAQVLVPEDDVSYDEGLVALRHGITRLREETSRKAHPVMGSMSIAQWNRFHLRHADLHLSFFAPPTSART